MFHEDRSWYYKPESYGDKFFEDDGVRGRRIDGKGIADELRKNIKAEIETCLAKGEATDAPADGEAAAGGGSGARAPGLVVLLVGEDPASQVYVGQKHKACKEVGILSTQKILPADTTPEALTAEIKALNEDPAVHGILLQLPLPGDVLKEAQADILETIAPHKDVDGFHPYNLGKLLARAPTLRPCTPYGIMHLLWSTGVNPFGLDCLVVGASNIVGRPMVNELLLAGCVVKCVHRWCRDLEASVRAADCVVVACGKPGVVRGEWIKPGAIVIDVGINRITNEETGKSKLVGDVDFDEAVKHAGWITPVPGGVGPMTVAMLLRNTVYTWRKAEGV